MKLYRFRQWIYDDKYSAHFDFLWKEIKSDLSLPICICTLPFFIAYFIEIPFDQFLLRENYEIIDWFIFDSLLIFVEYWFSLNDDLFRSFYFMWLFVNRFWSFLSDFSFYLVADLILLLDKFIDLFQFTSIYLKASTGMPFLLILDDVRREKDNSFSENVFEWWLL